MSTIRQIDIEQDYPTLCKWWEGHKAVILPKHIIPRGWMVSAGGIDIAAAFLLLDVGGTWAVIEFLTTNPTVAFSRYLVEDIRRLVAHIEALGIAQGCTFIGSFVAPGAGEERLMTRLGYQKCDGPAHILYVKPLGKEGG